jgi:ubiquinone/menaquinone biosynthesis C-methylase UbiE
MNAETDGLLPTQRFSSRVDDYAKYRPGYPAELIPLLQREAGLSPATILADIGSGTGILTEIFLRSGNPVFAVEPNPGMRSAAERMLSNWPKFHSIDGTAENTGLADASVDGIVVAQAFHWFDHAKAMREFRRILKPAGFVALIWNARKTANSPFMAAYERIVATRGSDFARSGRELVPYETLKQLFHGNLTQHLLPNYQDLDWPGVRGRLLSASYMPLTGQKGHDEMIAELREAYDQFQKAGVVRLHYDTQVYLGRLTAGQA